MSEINAAYLQEENLVQCRELFFSEGSITLQMFFDEAFYVQLQEELEAAQFELKYHPIEHRYERCNVPSRIEALFSSEKFIKIMNAITENSFSSATGECIRCTWKDYSILDDRAQEDAGIDIVIDLNDGWDPMSGGRIVYVNGSGDYVPVEPMRNSITIVKRNKEDQKFIHYCNHYAQGKARLLILGNLN